MDVTKQHWDAVVIGTGFGGSMTALKLAEAGLSVLVLERGRWVDRDDSAWDTHAIHVEQKYRSPSPFEAPQFGGPKLLHPNETVGGNSVFYGAASLRLREIDFARRSRFIDHYLVPWFHTLKNDLLAGAPECAATALAQGVSRLGMLAEDLFALLGRVEAGRPLPELHRVASLG